MLCRPQPPTYTPAGLAGGRHPGAATCRRPAPPPPARPGAKGRGPPAGRSRWCPAQPRATGDVNRTGRASFRLSPRIFSLLPSRSFSPPFPVFPCILSHLPSLLWFPTLLLPPSLCGHPLCILLFVSFPLSHFLTLLFASYFLSLPPVSLLCLATSPSLCSPSFFLALSASLSPLAHILVVSSSPLPSHLSLSLSLCLFPHPLRFLLLSHPDPWLSAPSPRLDESYIRSYIFWSLK